VFTTKMCNRSPIGGLFVFPHYNSLPVVVPTWWYDMYLILMWPFQKL